MSLQYGQVEVAYNVWQRHLDFNPASVSKLLGELSSFTALAGPQCSCL